MSGPSKELYVHQIATKLPLKNAKWKKQNKNKNKKKDKTTTKKNNEKEKAKWEVSLINSYLAFYIFLSFLFAFFYHIVIEIR